MDIMQTINGVFSDLQQLQIQPTEHNVTRLHRCMQGLRTIAQATADMAGKIKEAEADTAPEDPNRAAETGAQPEEREEGNG